MGPRISCPPTSRARHRLQRILTHKPQGRTFDYASATLFAARQRGLSSWRIAWEVLLLSRGPGRLRSDEYFLHGAWKPGLTSAERRAFVGRFANRALNRSLNPPGLAGEISPVSDKLRARAMFAAAGLPQPETLAVAGPAAPGEGLRWLDGEAAILAFLREPGVVPCFGKPVHGSLGAGAVSVLEISADGQLLLGNGVRVSAASLAAEIWRDHRKGFLFQELVRPSAGLEALIGPVIGTLRVVTTDAGKGPQVLYAVLKTPAARAMVDSGSGPLGGIAAVETETGRILRVQDRRQMGGMDLARNPVTGVGMVGAVLPDFDAALRLAVAAHAALGEWGILGLDVLLSAKGALVNEANANPHHAMYQTAFTRGILNPDILPRLQAVRARFGDRLPRQKGGPLQ